MSYITVCTPTYNRAYILRRPFESLINQTFKDFIWLIIDDGSNDNTEDIVKRFQNEADFEIKYVRKENGGRASALNASLKYITSKYVINLDSDDALAENGLEILHDLWKGISKEERFWCITGQCIDSQTGEICGGRWPEDINEFTGRKQHKIITKHKRGEKWCCRRVDILGQHPFPEYPETKFVSENVVWEKINLKYDQYCTNEVIGLYYTDSNDSLSSGTQYDNIRKATFYYQSLFYVNECFSQITYNKNVLIAIPRLTRCALLIGRPYSVVMREINSYYKKILVSLMYPPIWIYNKFI